MKCTCKDIALVIKTACKEISLIGLFALLLMFYLNIDIISNPYIYKEDYQFGLNHFSVLNYSHSNLYKNQIDVGYTYIKSIGFYNKFEGNVLKVNYGINFEENNYNHRFRFLLVDLHGFFYKNLLYYGELEKEKSGKYLFRHFGIKLVDWNNLDMLKSDFTPLKLEYDLLLENRGYKDHGFGGLSYFPNKHNFYLQLTPNIGVSKLNATNIFEKKDSLENDLSFWDVDYGVNAKLGYELKLTIEDSHYDRMGREHKYSYDLYNSLVAFLSYRNFPFNQFSIIEYGAVGNFYFTYLIGFQLSYSVNKFYIEDKQKDYYQICLNYKYHIR